MRIRVKFERVYYTGGGYDDIPLSIVTPLPEHLRERVWKWLCENFRGWGDMNQAYFSEVIEEEVDVPDSVLT